MNEAAPDPQTLPNSGGGEAGPRCPEGEEPACQLAPPQEFSWAGGGGDGGVGGVEGGWRGGGGGWRVGQAEKGATSHPGGALPTPRLAGLSGS